MWFYFKTRSTADGYLNVLRQSGQCYQNYELLCQCVCMFVYMCVYVCMAACMRVFVGVRAYVPACMPVCVCMKSDVIFYVGSLW